tara:strand:+ start:402 stop:1148 length:747 start_codon:yes stop_codon:yes gene_type:complete
MEKLWIYGDSFSVGSGLNRISNPPPSAWPTIIAEELNYKLVNRAKGGASCSSIIQELCQSMHYIKENDFVIIGGTHAARMDYWDWVAKYWINITPGLAQNDMMYLPSQGRKNKYIAFHEKSILGDGIGRPDLRKLMAKYFINIRYEGEEFYWERYLRIFQGLQKELKRRNIDSILWNWWGPGLNEITPDKEIKDVTELVNNNANFCYETLVDRGIKDYHWSDKGNKQFANRLVEKILNGETYWENIYE